MYSNRENRGEIQNLLLMTKEKKRSSEILADESQAIFREKVKLLKFIRKSENLSEIGGKSETGGKCIMILGGWTSLLPPHLFLPFPLHPIPLSLHLSLHPPSSSPSSSFILFLFFFTLFFLFIFLFFFFILLFLFLFSLLPIVLPPPSTLLPNLHLLPPPTPLLLQPLPRPPPLPTFLFPLL